MQRERLLAAARAHGWNSWGRPAARKRARLDPGPGLLVGGPERVAEALAAYRDAGADWVILGPLDSADADNAAVLGERIAPLLGSRLTR